MYFSHIKYKIRNLTWVDLQLLFQQKRQIDLIYFKVVDIGFE